MGMVDEIKPRYPEIGARRLVDLLRTRYQVKVPEWVLVNVDRCQLDS